MDPDINDPREAVVDVGRDRLVTHGIEALKSLLNASALSRAAPVSRDTAYRIFRDDPDHPNVTDAIVTAVAEAAHDPAWMGYDTAVGEAIAAYQAALEASDDRGVALRKGLTAVVEANLRSPGLPATWLLQAAAFSASDAWQGTEPDPEGVELARQILEMRRRSYHAMEKQISSFVAAALSFEGRRLVRGLDVPTMALLIHCLLDGAVLRCLIDPELMTPSCTGEAIYGVIWALTETGPVVDPRRPDDEASQAAFDRLLDAAYELWAADPAITVHEVADEAGVPVEAAVLLFPTVGDLADSLVRARVVAHGFPDLGPLPSDAKINQHLVGLVSELRTLRDLADDRPHVLAAAQAHPPTRSAAFVDDFVDNESRVVAAVALVPDPVQLVRDLVTFAAQGTAGWPAVTALLRSIGYDSDDPTHSH